MGIGNQTREIVILAKSRKHSAYCIAGIDCKNIELVRVITDNKDNHYAVTAKDIEDDNGKVASIYDNVVIVTSENEVYIPQQPENIMLDTGYYVSNKGRYRKENLRKIVNLFLNKYEYIFYNTNKCISKEEIKHIEDRDLHSLEIIKAKKLTLRVKDIEKRSLKASILYNGEWYSNFSVTDIEFEKKMFDVVINSPMEYLTIRTPYILISLGEEYYGKYYKLIASVLEI